MINKIKKWFEPETFTVTYCKEFGMLKNRYDKISFDNLEDAKKRLEFLNTLTEEEILAGGFEFVPVYLNIEQVTSVNQKGS